MPCCSLVLMLGVCLFLSQPLCRPKPCKSPLMMANFVQNDISPLIFFYFWQPVYYLLDAEEQSFPGKSKEMRARWAGIDENIGTKMCWKLVDDNSGEIINRSTILTDGSLCVITQL